MNELPEIAGFYARLPGFDTLPEAALDQAARGTAIAYYPRGEDILDVGGDNELLHVVRSGAVELRDADDELVLRLAEGEGFGVHSLMNRAPVRYRCHAIEDTLIYHLDGDVFAQLRRHHPKFDTHFVRALTDRLVRGGSEGVALGTAGQKAGELLTRPPVTLSPAATVREAAQTMTRDGVSSLMIVDGDALVGIVTDRDLRTRVLAAGIEQDVPIQQVMTPDPLTIDLDAHAHEAAILMLEHGIHHVPVMGDSGLAGLVSRSDFMRVETEHPLYLVHDIGKQHSVEALAAICRRLPGLIARLIDSDANGEQLGHFITAVTDAVTRQLLRIGESALGAAPFPYAWVALGSQARREQSAKSDQDNALILERAPMGDEAAWFESLARIVNDGLDACGYVYCPGEVMASNPRWRQPLEVWQDYFRTWITVPEEKALMHANIFFDLRHVHGEVSFVDTLRDFIPALAKQNEIFLALMAKNALAFQPPLGFFRQFVLEKSGDHRNTFDLKRNGIMPVVELARIRALACGVMHANTRRRLDACGREGELTADDARSLIDALDLIEKLRLQHQSAQMHAGQAPDNHLAPDTLSPLARHNLKAAFQQIATSQKAMQTRFGLT